jgi:hypothetical protein
MEVRSQLSALLNKKMDRQDFMKHVAIGVVSLMGVGTALRLLASPKQERFVGSANGYGGSAYGGDSGGPR